MDLERTAESSEDRRLEKDSKDLANFFVRRYETEPVGDIQKGLCFLSSEIKERHGDTLEQLIAENNLTSKPLTPVLHSTISDGCINWGRLAAMFTYVAILARVKVGNLREEEKEAMQQQMADELQRFIVRECGAWIKDNGGWETMAHLDRKKGLTDELPEVFTKVKSKFLSFVSFVKNTVFN